MDTEQIIAKLALKVKRGFPPGELPAYLQGEGYQEEITQLIRLVNKAHLRNNKASSPTPVVSAINLAGICLLITGLAIQPIAEDFLLPNLFVILGACLILPSIFQFIKKHFVRK